MAKDRFLEFQVEVEKLINYLGLDAEMKTPDWLIANYLYEQLKSLRDLLQERGKFKIPNITGEF